MFIDLLNIRDLTRIEVIPVFRQRSTIQSLFKEPREIDIEK